MLRLSVTSRIHGAVVDLQVVDVTEELWIGDLGAAEVSFPGAVFRISRIEGPRGSTGVHVHGAEKPITLLPGGNLVIDLSGAEGVGIDGFEIELALVHRTFLAREKWYLGDMRLLVLTGAVVLLGMWIDTVNRWSRTPEIAAEIEALPALWTRQDSHPVEVEPEPTYRSNEVKYQD